MAFMAACSGPDRGGDLSVTATAPPEASATGGPGPSQLPSATPTSNASDEASVTASTALSGATASPSATNTVIPAPPSPTDPARPSPTSPPTDTPATTPTSAPPVDLDRIELDVEQVGAGFTEPLSVTHANDGSGRIFVAEKIGTIKLLDGTLFLDIRDRVIDAPGVFGYEHEQGFLGLAFHPRFAENGYFYVHYNDVNGAHVIARYSVGADGLGDPASEKVLLAFPQPEVNFQGGGLVFGPDGYLYIGTGTGGTAVELQYLALDVSSLYGKILRIDVDGGDPYGIPPDNPFVDDADARPEVWAIGLRNPYRFSFDRANGDLYIGGPGEFVREWVNYQPGGTPGGVNFGWPMYEGSACWHAWNGPCDPTGLSLPILEYDTYSNGGCVVIGGHVYRGPSYPILHGAYLYGDFCNGDVWVAARDASGAWQSELKLRLGIFLSSFGEDENGELYLTDLGSGAIYRIIATDSGE
jgi:glucose/arabinose dehydrogenase